jgi:hypothetical protein
MMSSSTQTKKSRGGFAPVDATHAVRLTTHGQVEGCLPEVKDDCSSTRNSARRPFIDGISVFSFGLHPLEPFAATLDYRGDDTRLCRLFHSNSIA